MSKRTRGDYGGTLIGVLWVALLLALLALGSSKLSISHRKLPSASHEALKNKLIAESAITLFVNRYMIDESGNYVFTASFQALETDVTVALEIEDAKIGLNKADYHLLSAVFASKGYSQDVSEEIANAIIDWRDRDDIVTRTGGEATEYAAMGLTYTPRNGAFESVGELGFVKGTDIGTVSCVNDLITAYSSPDISDVELAYASEAVRNVFEWAFTNDWHGQTWPPIDDASPNPEPLDLSSKSIMLRVLLFEDNPLEYTKVIRIKSSSDDDIVYSVLRPLRLESKTSRCPS